jgi:hypothetical protein
MCFYSLFNYNIEKKKNNFEWSNLGRMK